MTSKEAIKHCYEVVERNDLCEECKKEKDGIHVDVVVKIHYAQSVSDTAFKIQEAVRHNVEAMTEYHVASVNVIIHGVTFEDKTEEAPVQNPTSENVQEG